MPPGFNNRCTVCRSPRRVEIDERLLRGEGVRPVSRWLLEEHGEAIGKDALARHHRDHSQVAEDIAERAAQAAKLFESAVQSGLNRVQALEENAQIMIQVRDEAWAALRTSVAAKEAPRGLVQLCIGAATEARQSIQAVQKALGEGAPPPGDDSDARAELDGLLSRLAATRGTQCGTGEAQPASS